MEKRAKIEETRTKEEWRTLAVQHIPIDDPLVLEWVNKHHPNDVKDILWAKTSLEEAEEKLRVFKETNAGKIFDEQDIPERTELKRLRKIQGDLYHGEQAAETSAISGHTWEGLVTIRNDLGEEVSNGLNAMNRNAVITGLSFVLKEGLRAPKHEINKALNIEINALEDVVNRKERQMRAENKELVDKYKALRSEITAWRNTLSRLESDHVKHKEEAMFYMRLGIPRISFELAPKDLVMVQKE